jgi:hypothetical protein
MFWLTWRQHRLQVFAVAAVLAVMMAEVVRRALPLVEPTGLMRDCASGAVTDCDDLFQYFGVDSGTTIVLAAVHLLPVLVGVFWGAPLIAREFDRGTQRLVWGQSVSRRRWLAVKLATLGAAAVLGGIVQGVLLTWAIDQFVVRQSVNRFADRALFDVAGVVPPALWLFALVLGVAVGLRVRRTIVAMAITPLLLGVVLVGLNLARPHYAPVQTRDLVTLRSGPDVYKVHEDWVLESALRRADGRTVSFETSFALCGGEDYSTCLAGHGLTQVVIYHPESRYWRFQWTEAAILLAGAMLISTLVFVRVSRRAD